ncbi:hypothetical protein EVAR_30877_1 [Eumeta japonica]|uniref:PiggyBac transposable element-derived protein domain-containing protein n=1 Tax=Eumeta variegata TaxID=151549 RepID=A0A4C1V3Z4_EUMVA|nr:hypothetical protein EVAR_30877_1 [Eumeta japonica]
MKILSFLDIPSGSEDGQDFSDAESDDDIEKVSVFVSHQRRCYEFENRQPEISNSQPSSTSRITLQGQLQVALHNLRQPPSGSPEYDRLHKIRPILETLRRKFQSVPKREALSVDEANVRDKRI